MLAQDAAALEALDSVDQIWGGAQDVLKPRGIEFLNYITVDDKFHSPQVLTNISQIYGDQPPENDPFLGYCCNNYAITLTGVAYLPDYDYLPPEAQRFIIAARKTGFSTGLGIPMRLRGSTRFGGFNLGTRMERDEFEAKILPDQEAFRTFCLILHRRIEELQNDTATETSTREPDGFRKLLIAQHSKEIADLSAREQEVAHLVAAGYSRKECARLCGISHHTVSDYVKSIYRKLGVNDRVKLARMLED